MNLEQLLEKYPILKRFPNLLDLVAHVYVLLSDDGVLFCDSVQWIPSGYKELTMEKQQLYLVQYYKFARLCTEKMTVEEVLNAMPGLDVAKVREFEFTTFCHQCDIH